MSTTQRRTEIASFGYHDVTDDPRQSGFQRNSALPFRLGSQLFKEHLDRISAVGRAPALVTDIGLTSPGRHVLLTFDDGGKSALWIGEELCRRGWRGHFFITTGLIGRRTFLDTSAIRQLRSCGHVIGSHSHTHPDSYRELEWERMIVEWRQSADILEQLLGEPCVTGSVPEGEISPAVLRSAGVAGLRYLFTSEPSPAPQVVGGCWVLGRFCVKATTPSGEIAQLARFNGWSTKLLARRLTFLARRSMPSLFRLYVSRSTREWREQSQ